MNWKKLSAFAPMLAEEASESQLGCRYIRSKIQGMLDDQIFEDPYQKKFRLSMA